MNSISVKQFEAIFSRTASARIAVLGDLMLDVYVSGSASRLSQEAPVPILLVRKSETRLGGAANVMRNLTSLAPKCRVFAFGIAGDDAQGDVLRELLKNGRVDTAGIVSVPGRRTTVKQRVIAGAQQIVRMDFEETGPVAASVRAEIAERICAMIRAGALDAVIFEDYAKGLLEKEMLQSIADTAAECGVFTSLDPHPGHDMRVRGISLMTPNRSEAFGLAGVYCSEPDEVVEHDAALKLVAKKVLAAWEPASLLVTLGHQGMALFKQETPDELFAIPTIAREVFDVSGAGDTVIAAYTLCMAAGAKPEEAAEISNHAAGIVVGKAGTAVTDEAELRASFS